MAVGLRISQWCHMSVMASETTVKSIFVFNTLRPRQNGRHFPDDTFKRIFLNENVRISIKISLMVVPKGPINNIPALVQIMAWRRSGDKPLSEPMMVSLPTHICVTRPQCVNSLYSLSTNKYQSNISLTFCEGNSAVIGRLPSQRDSYTESVSMSWRRQEHINITQSFISPHSLYSVWNIASMFLLLLF